MDREPHPTKPQSASVSTVVANALTLLSPPSSAAKPSAKDGASIKNTQRNFMRVSRESLIRIAKETAQERAFNDRGIIAAYLTGSLVSKEIDPILGGTADIDVILVHAMSRCTPRICETYPDFHVDISIAPQQSSKARASCVWTRVGGRCMIPCCF